MKTANIFRNFTVFVCLLVATLSNLSAQTRTTFRLIQPGATEHAVDIPNVQNPNNDGALIETDVANMIEAMGNSGARARYLSNPQNNGAGNWQRSTDAGVSWTNIAEGPRLIRIYGGLNNRIRFRPTAGGGGSVVTLDFYAVRVRDTDPPPADSYENFAAARTASSFFSNLRRMTTTVQDFPLPQVITFIDPTSGGSVRVNETLDLTATTNAPGLTDVRFTITTTPPGIATLSNDGTGDGMGSLDLTGEGTVVVTATQAGGDGTDGATYAEGTAMRTFTVATAGLAQTITFDSPNTGATFETITLMATATSGLSVTFSFISQTPAGGDVAALFPNNMLRLRNPGMVTVRATQTGGMSGGNFYLPTTETQIVTVTASQTRTTFGFRQAGTQHSVAIPDSGNPNPGYTGALAADIVHTIRNINIPQQGGLPENPGRSASYFSNPQNNGAGNWQRSTDAGVSWTNIAEGPRLIRVYGGHSNRIRFLPAECGGGRVVTLDFYAVRVSRTTDPIPAESYENFAAARAIAPSFSNVQTMTTTVLGPRAQTITFTDLPDMPNVGQTIPLVATTDAPDAAMLPVAFTSSDNDVAEIVSNMDGTFSLELKAIGDVTITAEQAGGVGANGITYCEADDVMQDITVIRGTQTITFTSTDAGNVGVPITLAATASSGLTPVTFMITAGGAFATLDTDTNILSLIGVGTVEITATQAGDANYEAATQTQIITVSPATHTLSFTLADTGTSGETIDLMATSQDAGGNTITAAGLPAIIYTSSNDNVAEVRGQQLILKTPGMATITASRGGGTVGIIDYGAAIAVTQDITVGEATQTIMFTLADNGMSGDVIPLTATANSGLAITYMSSDENVAEVRAVAGGGQELLLKALGPAIITASRDGDTVGEVTYAAATDVTQDIIVGEATHTLVFTLDDTGTSGTTIALTATSQDADGNEITGLPDAITYTSNAPDVAMVRNVAGGGQELVLLMDGMATITASRAGGIVGDITYMAATDVTEDITVEAAAHTLVFTLDDTGTSGATLALTATSQDAGGNDIAAGLPAVTYVSDAPNIAEVRGGQLVLLMDGMATITASRGGGTVGGVTYAAATDVAQTITVSAAAHTLVFVLDDTGTSGATLALTATSQDAAGVDIAAGLPDVTYVSDAPNIAEVRGGQLVLLMDGMATITASRGGGTVGGVTYGPATDVTQTITVSVAAHTLVFDLDDTGTSGATLALTATSQDAAGVDIAAGLPAVTYVSDAPNIAEVRGGQLVLLMDGMATITASRGGGTVGGVTYGPATDVTQTITVSAAAHTLVFDLDDTGTSGATLALTATSQDAAGVDIAAGLPAVTYVSDAPDIAVVRGGQLVLLMDGMATITASRGGGTVGGITYMAATDVTQTITVSAAAHTLVFMLSDGTSGESMALAATSQDGGGTPITGAGLPAITYVSDAPDIAEVRGGQLVLLMPGTATITVSRGGGTVGGITYAAATDVAQTITVSAAAHTLVFTLSDGTSGESMALAATSQDGGGNEITGLPDPITYMSSAPGIAVVRGGQLVLLMPGMATITASRGGGTVGEVTYGPATDVTQTITVSAVTHTLVFTLSDGTSGESMALAATSEDGGGNEITGLPDVTYTSDAPGIAVVRGGQLVLLMPGMATITASRGGGTVGEVTYGPATDVTQTITVSAAAHTLVFTLPNTSTSGTTLALMATSQDAAGVDIAAGLPDITYMSSAPAIAEVRGGQLVLLMDGMATITASRTGGTVGEITYMAATATQTITVGAATHTLVFTLPNTGTSGTTLTLTATSQDAAGVDIAAGLPDITYMSSAPAIAEVRGGQLVLLMDGMATITASRDGGTVGGVTYAAATATQTITVGAATHTLVFTLPNTGTSGTMLVLEATSQDAGGVDIAAGLPAITYVSDAPDIAEVRGGQLVLLMDGMATITASRDGGTVGGVTYAAATATQTITVGAAMHTLVFTLPNTGTSGTTLALTATSQDADGNEITGLPDAITYTSDAPDIAEVRGGQLVLLMDGMATITASRTGGTVGGITYAAATATQTITVGAATHTLVFVLDDTGTSGQVIPLTATSQDAGGNNIAVGLPAITYMSSAPAIAEVRGGQLVLLMAGTATITASRGGGTVGGVTYRAATNVAQTITVSAVQVITFDDLTGGNPVSVGDIIPLVATTGTPDAAMLLITFESSATGIAEIINNMDGTFSLKLIGAGEVEITAKQGGGRGVDLVTYAPAIPVTQTIMVGRGPQDITFNSANAGAVGTDIELMATASSGLDVTFEVTTGDAFATLNPNGTTLSLTAAGTVTITATQTGDGNYNAATPVTHDITVSQGAQDITFTSPEEGTAGTTIELMATGGDSGNPVTFSIAPGETRATLTGGNDLTLTGTGTVTVTATQAGNANYAEGTQTQTITVNQGTQGITFTSANAGIVDTDIELMVTASSGLDVTFAITTETLPDGLAATTGEVATLVDNTLSLKHVGDVTITATQAGNASYAMTTQTQTITVSKGTQEIMFMLANTGTVGTDIELMATGGASGESVTFSIESGGSHATFDGGTNTLSLKYVGDVTVVARQAGNTNYEAAPKVEQTITVSQGTQDITFTDPTGGATVRVGQTVNLMASTNAPGLFVRFSIVTTPPDGVATLVDDGDGLGSLDLIGEGTVTVTATEDSNIDYAPATEMHTITVSAMASTSQTITFTTPATSPVAGNVGEPITLAATATSGLPVTFEITEENQQGTPVAEGTMATLNAGVTLNLAAAGTVVITATQAGGLGADGKTYEVATKEQTIEISPGTQGITFNDPSEGSVGGTVDLAAVTSAPDLFVTFSIVTNPPTGVATMTDDGTGDGMGSLTLNGVGTVTITAEQEGDVNYYPATNMEQTITVSQGAQDITFNDPGEGAVGQTVNLMTRTNAPGLFARFSIDDSMNKIATLIDNGDGTGSLTLDGVGMVTVTASQEGDVNYMGATDVEQTIRISQGTQDIAFTPPTASTVGTTIELEATGGASGNPVMFSIASGESQATLTDNDLTLTGAGTVTIIATQDGDDNYNAATPVTQDITVSKGIQTITFTTPTLLGEMGETIPISATGGASGKPVTFEIATQAVTSGTVVATLDTDTNILSLVGTGTVTITATQDGNENYEGTTAMQTITVEASIMAQTITFNEPASDVTDAVVNQTIPLMAATDATGLFVRFSIVTNPPTGVATLTDDGTGDGMGSLNLIGKGEVTVTASQTGNEAYEGAMSITRTITVGTVLGIEEDIGDFVLYPNPTSGKLHFSEQVAKFRLYSVEGRLLETSENVRSADLTARPPGLYFVEVIRSGRSVRYRIMRK